MLVVGSGGVWGAISIVNLKLWVVHKLGRMILLHFGLLDVSMTPKTDYFQLWTHQMIPTSLRKIRNHYWETCFWEVQHFGQRTIYNLLQRRVPNNPEDPWYKFLKLII